MILVSVFSATDNTCLDVPTGDATRYLFRFPQILSAGLSDVLRRWNHFVELIIKAESCGKIEALMLQL